MSGGVQHTFAMITYLYEDDSAPCIDWTYSHEDISLYRRLAFSIGNMQHRPPIVVMALLLTAEDGPRKKDGTWPGITHGTVKG